MEALDIQTHAVTRVTIHEKGGDTIWEGTTEALGFLLNALRGDLIKEWRCWREDRSYGPPCRNKQDRDQHDYTGRHATCCWIVYYEIREN